MKNKNKKILKDKFDLLVSKTLYLKGTVKSPASKSYTHRAIIIGSMNKSCRIVNPLYADDILATIKVWRALGAKIYKYPDHLDVIGFGGNPLLKEKKINVNESGTLLRFVLSVLCYSQDTCTIVGNGTLCKRPNTTLVEILRSFGMKVSGKGEEHKLPITIEGTGRFRGGECFVNGTMSSQVVSSLLIASPKADKDTIITIKNSLVSKPYVDITIDVLNWAGIHVENENYNVFKIKAGQEFSPKDPEFKIHGDYSSSAFLMAAACLVKSNIVIDDLVEDKQGDKIIIKILNKMGANIKKNNNGVSIRGPFKLKGIEIDCCDYPDLVPILVVLGSFAEGKTRIYNVSHLVYKESNRLYSTINELKKIGAKTSVLDDEIIIEKSRLSPGVLSSNKDHRVAMALAVAGLRIGGLTIKDSHCLSKSYPNFLEDMKTLGAKLRKKTCSNKK